MVNKWLFKHKQISESVLLNYKLKRNSILENVVLKNIQSIKKIPFEKQEVFFTSWLV